MTDTDIVERLSKRRAFFLNGAHWLMGSAPDADCEDAKAEILSLRTSLEEANARVVKLEERLEIDYVWGPSGRVEIPPESRDQQIDGIDARDETIKLLERERDEARAKLDDLQMHAIDSIAAGWVSIPIGEWGNVFRALKGGGE